MAARTWIKKKRREGKKPSRLASKNAILTMNAPEMILNNSPSNVIHRIQYIHEHTDNITLQNNIPQRKQLIPNVSSVLQHI